MGMLDKDIKQKECAVRFCLVSGMMPFLEVNVGNRKELSSISTIITDIDAMGVGADASGGQRKIIFDCKTLGKTSPINRAFWACGLVNYVGASEAFVILKKKASEAHRLSAKHIGVHLFGENQFDNFAQSYSIDYKLNYSYATDIQNWILQHELYNKSSVFEKFGEFLNHEVPLELDAARGVKRLLAALKKGKGEFNPDRAKHGSVFLHVLLSFSFLMSKVVHDLKTVIDYDSGKEDFEEILKYYIWGGRDSLIQKQKMAELFASINKSPPSFSMEIPEWERFVELTRKLLDSPKDVFWACFPLRELSLRLLSSVNDEKDLYIAKTVSGSARIRQFMTFQADYLVHAGQLPKEFADQFKVTLDELKSKM